METQKSSQEYANWKAPETGRDPSDKAEDQSPNLNPEGIDVPQKYQGMPSEMVEEMWVDEKSVDGQANQQMENRREQALQAIRAQEQIREQSKTKELEVKYASLPEAKQKDFPTTQHEAASIIAAAIKGERQIDDLLKPEDQWILNKAKEVYEKQKETDPNASLTVQFEKPLDQTIYANLVNRLTFKLLTEKGQVADQDRTNEIRKSLDLPEQPVDTSDLDLVGEGSDKSAPIDGAEAADVTEQLDQESELKEPIGDQRAKEMAHNLLDELKGKGLIKQYDALNSLIDKADKKVNIAYNLLSFSYDRLRKAKYEDTEDTLKNSFDASQYAANDKTLPSKEENGWLYRGIFPSKSEGTKTESRGSLNVDLSQDMLREIDSLIASGGLKANYKFGAPGGPDSSARHDSISIYFLEKPSDEALSKLAIIAEKNARGDDLVGKKIGKGFAMSEIGSISDQQAEKFVQDLNAVDPELANAVNQHITKAVDGSNKLRTALSEGMFYAIKNSLDCYGLDIQYDANNGINITKR